MQVSTIGPCIPPYGYVEEEESKCIDENDLAVAVECFPLFVTPYNRVLIRQYLTW